MPLFHMQEQELVAMCKVGIISSISFWLRQWCEDYARWSFNGTLILIHVLVNLNGVTALTIASILFDEWYSRFVAHNNVGKQIKSRFVLIGNPFWYPYGTQFMISELFCDNRVDPGASSMRKFINKSTNRQLPIHLKFSIL